MVKSHMLILLYFSMCAPIPKSSDAHGMDAKWETTGPKYCDGKFDFTNRSDESGCEYRAMPFGFKKKEYWNLRKGLKLSEEMIARLDGTYRNTDKLLEFMVSLNLIYNESKCQVDNCSRGDCIEEVSINGTCHNITDLCSGMDPLENHDLFFHPEHIIFCQNYDYWAKFPNHTFYNGEILCRGNYPGFRYLNKTCGYIATCPDLSDIECEGNETICNNTEVFFLCRDGKTCIPNSLRCDGYEQCEDGSDENATYCKQCPLEQGDGHPFRDEANKWTNTFSCRHIYTERFICATKCDRWFDMCDGFEVEIGCDPYAWWHILLGTILTVLVLAPLLTVLRYVKWRAISNESSYQKGDTIQLHAKECTEFDPMCFLKYYDRYRQQGNFKNALIHNIIILREHDDNLVQEFCQNCYNKELILNYRTLVNYNQSDKLDRDESIKDAARAALKRTDKFFYDILGNNDVAKTFLDNIDNGWFFRTKKHLKTLKIVKKARRSPIFMFAWRTLNRLAWVAVYYFDFIKDFLLIIRLSQFLPPNLSSGKREWAIIVTFAIVLGAVTTTELANMAVVATCPYTEELTTRVIRAIFICFVPAYFLYKLFLLESDLQKRAKEGSDAKKILDIKKKIWIIHTQKMNLRSNENVLEHSILLVVLLTLILVGKSETTTVPGQLSTNLADIDAYAFTFYASATASCISLIRGTINHVVAEKKGFVPIVGQLILLAFILNGAAIRIFAILLFFTPSLGLMNTLYHGEFGLNATEEGESSKSFYEQWNNGSYTFDKPYDFFFIPFTSVAYTLSLMLVLHIVLDGVLKEMIYYKERVTSKKWIDYIHPRRVLEGLHTFNFPPIHLDWENIYRKSAREDIDISLQESFSRSMNLMTAYTVLYFIQSIVMLLPIFLLKIHIDERNNLLGGFPLELLLEERESTRVVNNLFYSGLATFLVMPLFQLMLLHTYFKRAHAWSRILDF